MSRTGPGECIVDLGVDLFAPAQKKRRGQWSRRRIELVEKPGTNSMPVAIEPDFKRPVGPAGVGPETLRVIDAEAQANSLGCIYAR